MLVKYASETCRIHLLLLGIESDIETAPHCALKHVFCAAWVHIRPEGGHYLYFDYSFSISLHSYADNSSCFCLKTQTKASKHLPCFRPSIFEESIDLRKWANNEKYCSPVQEDQELLSARTNRWQIQFVDGKSKILSFKEIAKRKSYLLIGKKLRHPEHKKDL